MTFASGTPLSGSLCSPSRSLFRGCTSVRRRRLRTRPEIGADYGSRLRWYVEGDTEEGAARLVVGAAEGSPIEVVNLQGSISEGKKEPTFRRALEADRRHGRFSLVSIDADDVDRVTAVRGAAKSGLIVGHVSLHDPDFELGNFDVEELSEILWLAAQEQGASQDFRSAVEDAASDVRSGPNRAEHRAWAGLGSECATTH